MESPSVEAQLIELAQLRRLLQQDRLSLAGVVAGLKISNEKLRTRVALLRVHWRENKKLKKQMQQLEVDKISLLKYIRELEQFLKVQPPEKDRF